MDLGLLFSGLAALAAVLAVVVGVWALIVSHGANRVARDANRIAERAVDEAARSASAAEEAVALQRREAAAAEAQRAEALKAVVIPVCWDTRAKAGELQGLQVRNHGPAIARDVVAVFQHGGGFSQTVHHALGIGETAVTRTGFDSADQTRAADTPLADGTREVSARAWWTNADGTEGDSGWLSIPRF